MKVLFDHQAFVMQKYGGVSRYFFELINQFNTNHLVEYNLTVKYSDNIFINKLGIADYPKLLPGKFKGKSTILNLLNKPLSIKKLKAGNFDLLHPTYYDFYFLNYLKNKKFILTVHDMTHELFPDKVSRWDKSSQYKKVLVEKASKIICVSNNTKSDLCRLFKTNEDKIEVIYLASSLKKSAENIKNSRIPEKYILFVGTRGYYKNFSNFITAATPLLKNDKDVFLICAGGGKLNHEEISRFIDLGISEKVIYRDADDELLQILYSNAALFVFPSLYEGFGIPLIEAFNCECPVITSNVSSLPEIAGDAAYYFDPYDLSSIASALEKLLYDTELKKSLIKKGQIRGNEFTWEKTSRLTSEVYKSI